MRSIIFLTVEIIIAAATGYAQPPGNTEIRLKTSALIGGWVKGDTLFIRTDGPVKFPLEYVNRDSNGYNVENGFVFYSPDGANWAHATANGGNVKSLPLAMTGIWVDTTGFYQHLDFSITYKFNLWSADGSGRDTVSFFGQPYPGDLGAHPQDSGIFFYAIIRPKLADTGKHICIDSISNFPSIHPWRWRSANYSPGFSTYPTWNGPFCFVLASSCCWGVTGNVDCDPADGTDISDLSGLIDNLYISFGPLCCKQAANIDGSLDGNVDISDLTALIDHLYISFTSPAPCR